MFEKILYFISLTVYTALLAVLLVQTNANVLLVMLCLSVIPAGLLWYVEKLHTRLLPYILGGALVATTVVETIAYINGLWYEVTPFDVRVFGLFPLEAFVAGFVHILYFIVVYEYFFDDKKTSVRKTHVHTPHVVAIAGVLLALALSYAYLFSSVFFAFPFAVLILLGFVLFSVALSAFRKSWKPIIVKGALFAVAILPISLMYEFVALQNNLRFFANYQEYFYTFSLFGQLIPIEELLFVVVVPFWVAVIYELYLDDGK